ncbi:MAG: hypothetical protein KDE27_16545 [Planctomycetes bacterium]|nr:hypothetical protein [Planctomycetota bacterium]
MNHSTTVLFASALLTGVAAAQGPDFLFTVSQAEQTLTGSGGTVLQNLYPNDIVGFAAMPCPSRVEKWAPREAFEVMAGDENGNDVYQRINLFGAIDALLMVPSPIAGSTFSTLYFSPAAPMGTAVSGSPFRPGDIARIVRLPTNGQVEYFIRAEQIQIALGLPPSPIVIDVDAACFGYNQGLYLSIDVDIACSPCGGPTVMRDGDIFCLPPWAYTTGSGGTIVATAPGSAIRVYTENQVNAMTANAQVKDRFGVCVTTIGDVEALDIDWLTPSSYTVSGCGGVVNVPTLLFAGETLTGGAVLTTDLGGSIQNAPCWPLGTGCSSIGATLGDQLGLQPPSAVLGVASHVNALAGNTRIFEFAAEAATPQIPAFSPATIDFVTPPTPLVWVFMTFAPGGPAAVPLSLPFVWGWLGFPEYYPAPNFMGLVPGITGYATYTSPAIPWPVDLVFQGATLTGSSIELSTPTMVEVF